MAEQIQQVTMKDPKKVEQGKRLAEWNCKNKKKLTKKAKVLSESETNLTYYGAGAVVAIGGVRCYRLLHLPIQAS